MPTVSLFLGIVVFMNYNDHMPPHFHARYQGHEASFTFDGELLVGTMPARQQKFFAAWALLHEEDLAANWELCRDHQAPMKIDPLR